MRIFLYFLCRFFLLCFHHDHFRLKWYTLGEAKKRIDMIIRRWRVPVTPDIKQIRQMFFLEGLKPHEEALEEGQITKERKFPFDEVRIIVEGELILDIAGNRVLLKEGDRVMIPSNTKHTLKCHRAPVKSLYASKIDY